MPLERRAQMKTKNRIRARRKKDRRNEEQDTRGFVYVFQIGDTNYYIVGERTKDVHMALKNWSKKYPDILINQYREVVDKHECINAIRNKYANCKIRRTPVYVFYEKELDCIADYLEKNHAPSRQI